MTHFYIKIQKFDPTNTFLHEKFNLNKKNDNAHKKNTNVCNKNDNMICYMDGVENMKYLLRPNFVEKN